MEFLYSAKIWALESPGPTKSIMWPISWDRLPNKFVRCDIIVLWFKGWDCTYPSLQPYGEHLVWKCSFSLSIWTTTICLVIFLISRHCWPTHKKVMKLCGKTGVWAFGYSLTWRTLTRSQFNKFGTVWEILYKELNMTKVYEKLIQNTS